jgi:hypothetical protein
LTGTHLDVAPPPAKAHPVGGRLGRLIGTHLDVGIEVIQETGYDFWMELACDTVPRTMMSLRADLTTSPSQSDGLAVFPSFNVRALTRSAYLGAFIGYGTCRGRPIRQGVRRGQERPRHQPGDADASGCERSQVCSRGAKNVRATCQAMLTLSKPVAMNPATPARGRVTSFYGCPTARCTQAAVRAQEQVLYRGQAGRVTMLDTRRTGVRLPTPCSKVLGLFALARAGSTSSSATSRRSSPVTAPPACAPAQEAPPDRARAKARCGG